MEAGFFSILPALVAIVLAFWTRNVLVSLGVALLLGCFTIAWLDGHTWFSALIWGVGEMGHKFWDSVTDPDKQKVTLFSLLVGATVGIMAVSGGTRGLVNWLTRYARTRRSGMLATWAAGLAVFFDDYANCMIVGSGMRPLADKLKFSREKLAYIVDSTAAPIASLALISTWAGYEVSLMDQGIQDAVSKGVLEEGMDGYGFFVAGVGYRFYCIFTIFFVFMIANTGRDFGPMLEAEKRAQALDPVADDSEDSSGGGVWKAWLAVLPMLTLIGMAFGYLYWSGVQALDAQALAKPDETISYGLMDIFGVGDGYQAMFLASVASVSLAALLALATKSSGLTQTLAAGLEGMGKMVGALLVLILAWSLAGTIGEGGLEAGDYLEQALSGKIPVWLFPTLVFVVSAFTAFATGTSFGTMGILVPTVLLMSFSMSTDPALHYAASGAVLSGACLGDHCSPISDTTVLSSLGTGCDHIEHVRTQLPYALACGLISILMGSLPVMLGVPIWLCLLAGLVACWGVVRVAGKKLA